MRRMRAHRAHLWQQQHKRRSHGITVLHRGERTSCAARHTGMSQITRTFWTLARTALLLTAVLNRNAYGMKQQKQRLRGRRL